MSSEKFLSQMDGISPILPTRVSSLKMRSRTGQGFLSSTPLTRGPVKRRISKAGPSNEQVYEGPGTLKQKKQKLSHSKRTKERNVSSCSDESSQQSSSRRLSSLTKSPRKTKLKDAEKEVKTQNIRKNFRSKKANRSLAKKKSKTTIPEKKSKVDKVSEEKVVTLRNSKKVAKKNAGKNGVVAEISLKEGELDGVFDKKEMKNSVKDPHLLRSNVQVEQLDLKNGDIKETLCSPKKVSGSSKGLKSAAKVEIIPELKSSGSAKIAKKSAGKVLKTRNDGKASNKLTRATRRRK
uniref:CaM_binding domain-containing protein n=1 Tax=Syphacia muris TaxID=451379 RepID=A0A0N5B039_9BILA